MQFVLCFSVGQDLLKRTIFQLTMAAGLSPGSRFRTSTHASRIKLPRRSDVKCILPNALFQYVGSLHWCAIYSEISRKLRPAASHRGNVDGLYPIQCGV